MSLSNNLLKNVTLLLLSALLFTSCKKSEEFNPVPLTDYLKLQKGAYITYRLDSTVFTNFGRNIEEHAYFERHEVDSIVTDNLGRPAWRVFTFIRDTAANALWAASGSYLITPSNGTIEVTENNLRQLRLVQPLRLDFYWEANRYFPLEPYNSIYNFSNDDDIQNWEYTYWELDGNHTLDNGQTVGDVLTVNGIDESINVPITIPTAYAAISYSVDKYAKGIGLIHQELIMWEYQPNLGGPSPYYIGFGIRRSMIDHN